MCFLGTLSEHSSEFLKEIMRLDRFSASICSVSGHYCNVSAGCRSELECMHVQLLTDLPRCVPQDISNATWAFATLRHHPGNTLMDAAAATAARTMPHFKPQEIANTLWCATLLHTPKESFSACLCASVWLQHPIAWASLFRSTSLGLLAPHSSPILTLNKSTCFL